MADNIIGLSFDLSKFDTQVQAAASKLQGLYDLALKVSEQDIKPGSVGGFTEINQKTAAVTQLVAAHDKLLASNVQIVQSSQNVSSASALEVKSLQDNIKAKLSYERVLKSNIAYQKELDKQLRAGTLTQDEYKAATINANINTEKTKNKLAEVTKEIKTQTQTKKQLAEASLKAAAAEAKIVNELSNDYKQLSKAALDATNRARNLALVAPGSSAAKQAATDAKVLNDKLKDIDATVGINNRNVGNYAGSFGKLYGVIRNVANILPGLGIGGVFLLALAPITKLISYVFELTEAEKTLAKNTKLLTDVREEANKTAGEEVSNLKIIYEATQNVALSTQERTKAAKYLQDTYPETFKNFTTEQILLGQAKEGYDLLTASILKNALAAAAKSELSKLSTEELQAFTDYTQKRAKLQAEIEGTRIKKTDDQIAEENGLTKPSQIATFKRNAAILADARRKDINQTVKDYDDKIKSIRDRQKILIDFVGAENLIDSILGKSKKGAAAKSSKEDLDSTKEYLDLEFELYKISQQRKISVLDDLLKDTKKSLGERLVLADMFYNAELELAKKTNDKEIAAHEDKIKVLNSNISKTTGTERNNLLLKVENEQKKIIIARAKYGDDQVSIEQRNQKRFTDIQKDEEAKRLAQLVANEQAIKEAKVVLQGAIEADTALRIGSLDKLFSEGKIRQRAYAKEKAKIENEALILSLTTQKIELEGLREVARQRGDDLVKLDNAIAAIQGKLLSAQNKDGGDKAKSQADEKEIYRQLELKGIEEFFSLAKALSSRYHATRIKQIQDERKALDENYNQEITNIQNSTISTQEKAAQIQILEAKHASDVQKLLDKENAEKTKAAKLDKAITIAKIITETALAVVHQLGSGDPYTAYARAILAGATGAAQLAIAIATPIPTFGEGTDNAPDGNIIVGEKRQGSGYEPEYVKPKNGAGFWTSRPMLLNGMSGGSVTPLSKMPEHIHLALAASMGNSMARMEQQSIADTGTKDAIERIGYDIVRAVRKQRGGSTTVIVNTERAAYVDRNFRR